MPDEVHAPSGATTGFLKKKIGPLEVWQIGVGIAGLFLAYMAYKNHAASSAGGPSSAPATSTTLPAGGAAPTDIGTTISGQLTDLTGQVGALQNQIGTLSPSGGAPATTTQSTNGFSSDITSLYSQIGASPDVAGAAYWQAKLGQPGLLDQFVGSNPQATSGFVTQEYQTQLHRAPDAAGAAYWQGQVQMLGATAEQAQFSRAVAGGAK